MNKRKVCVVVTARPSYSRIRTALAAIAAHSSLELQLVLAGTSLLNRFGNIETIARQDGYKIAARIHNFVEGDEPIVMAKTTGLAIMELATTFEGLQPDVVVTIADRFETIATSIAASYQNIPLAHIQGGEVTGSIDEKVRHANTKLSDLHFVSSEDAKRRVIRMGEDSAFVFNTGCPSMDIARGILDAPEMNFDPIEKYGGVGGYVDAEKPYVVVMQHSVTSEHRDSKSQIESTMNAVLQAQIPAFWFWPNADSGNEAISNGIRKFREEHNLDNIRFFKNMEPSDFLRLIKNSKCLIGNSSVGIRECSFLGVPVVNIGSRQMGRERGNNVIDCGYAASEIKAAIEAQVSHGHYSPCYIYGHGKTGEQIANLLASVDLPYSKTISY